MKLKLLALLPILSSPLSVVACSKAPDDVKAPEEDDPVIDGDNPGDGDTDNDASGGEEQKPEEPTGDAEAENVNGFKIMNTNNTLVIIEESLYVDESEINARLNEINHGLFMYKNYKAEDDTNTELVKISNAGNNLTAKTNPSFDGDETKFLAVFNTKSEVVYRYGYITKDEFTFNSLFWSDNLTKISDYMIWQEPIPLWSSDAIDGFSSIQWTQVVETSSSLDDGMKNYLNNELPLRILDISKNL